MSKKLPKIKINGKHLNVISGPKTISTKWCEHIELEAVGNNLFFIFGDNIKIRCDYWNYCPICGTKNPTKEVDEQT